MSVQWVSLHNICGYSLSGVRIKGCEKGGLARTRGLLITTSSAINIYGRQLSLLEKLIKYSVAGWIGCLSSTLGVKNKERRNEINR